MFRWRRNSALDCLDRPCDDTRVTTTAYDAAFGGRQQMEEQQQQQLPRQPYTAPLTPEERNDLRQRVLRGERLSVELAREVYLTLRSGQGAVVITGEDGKKKRSSKKKDAYSDQKLEADFSELGI